MMATAASTRRVTLLRLRLIAGDEIRLPFGGEDSLICCSGSALKVPDSTLEMAADGEVLGAGLLTAATVEAV